MKKILSLILCVCMVFSLCACAGIDAIKNTDLPPLPSKEPTPEPDAEPAGEPLPAADPTPEATTVVVGGEPYGAETGDRVIVSTKKTQEEFAAPDGDVILIFSYETPTVRIEGRSSAAEEINEQLRLLDEVYISGSGNEGGKNHLLEEATDNYSYVMAKGADLNTTFSSARTVKVQRADGSVVSFRYWTSVYTGGARDRRGYMGCSYSAVTGERLTLDKLSSDPVVLKEALSAAVVAEAQKNEALMSRLTQGEGDYTVALSALVRDGNWYFSGEGIVFFPEYGELVSAEEDLELPMFTVPYTALVGLIDEQYLPVKREGEGKINVVRLGDVEDGTVWSIDRLNISEGEELYLTVEGTVYDVSVSRSSYFDQVGEKNYFETQRLWYASFMSDCALQINVAVPGGMPDLMISYTDSGYAEHRLLLSESGVDGGLVLVDDTIQAVG